MKKAGLKTRSASNIERRGGKRKGAGRPHAGHVRAEYCIRPETKRKIEQETRAMKLKYPGKFLDFLFE
jgi:hypothetical protein